MSLWTKILDWILGAEFITTEDFRAYCNDAASRISSELSTLPDKMDSDSNGMISVREASSLIGSVISGSISWIKGLFK